MTHPHLDKRFDSAKAAQLALKSKDGSYGNFDRLKPAHTQIRLYRDRNRLQITWQEANAIRIFQMILRLAVYCLIIWISSLYIPLLAGVVGWGCFFLLLLGELIVNFNELLAKTNYHLIIDDRQICNLKDYEQEHKPIKISGHLRSQIEILAYNPGYTFDKCLDTNGKLVKGSTITIPPKLYLYCGDFEYSLPAHFSSTKFSQAELWWLGQELSDFLNLELQVIYPTPKVPPAPSCGGGC
jgi:hypothetical protein